MILLRRLAVTGTALLAVALGGGFSATQAFAAPATTTGHTPSVTTTTANHDSDTALMRVAQIRADSIGPSGTNAVATGELKAVQPSALYFYTDARLVWDYCWSAATQTAYIYLEGVDYICGNGGDAHTWTWGSVTNGSNLEICHSSYHSGTSTLTGFDQTSHAYSISDVAGGGCGLATHAGINNIQLNWGGETSPTWRSKVGSIPPTS